MVRGMATGLLAAAILAGPAIGDEPGKIRVEFNSLQPGDTGCRAVFVLNNGLDKAVEKAAFRLVAFDSKQHATVFLSLEIGALPVGKTRVLRFDLGEKVPCTEVSRVVLDDVTSCAGGGLTPAACLAAVMLSSRAGVPFDF